MHTLVFSELLQFGANSVLLQKGGSGYSKRYSSFSTSCPCKRCQRQHFSREDGAEKVQEEKQELGGRSGAGNTWQAAINSGERWLRYRCRCDLQLPGSYTKFSAHRSQCAVLQNITRRLTGYITSPLLPFSASPGCLLDPDPPNHTFSQSQRTECCSFTCCSLTLCFQARQGIFGQNTLPSAQPSPWAQQQGNQSSTKHRGAIRRGCCYHT